MPKPSPAEHLHADEEEMFERFLEGWRDAPSEETLLRAARLIAEATRVIAIGWADLLDEEIARPAREKVLRGETDRFPREVARTIAKLVGLAPRMVEWLTDRYLEQRSTAGIVEGFERFLASRNILPPPAPASEPAVVFVDVSGYTRLTEERGDEAAVLVAGRLQRAADAAAAANGGRLVKLLGDGAMLRFPDAERGVAAALGLVRDLGDSAGLTAHAGVHAGPVIVRDLDLYGRTVNLASRITGEAGPGEVLVSEAVVQAAGDGAIGFEPADTAALKGIAEPVTLYRALPR